MTLTASQIAALVILAERACRTANRTRGETVRGGTARSLVKRGLATYVCGWPVTGTRGRSTVVEITAAGRAAIAEAGAEIEDPIAEEIRLAGHLAEFVCAECDHLGEGVLEGIDAFVNGWINDDPPQHQPQAPGPRSPIELLVDRACGIEEFPA